MKEGRKDGNLLSCSIRLADSQASKIQHLADRLDRTNQAQYSRMLLGFAIGLEQQV